jgi:hypothetical protein
MVIFDFECSIAHRSDASVACYSCNTRVFRSKLKPWGTPTRYPAHSDIVGGGVCRVIVTTQLITWQVGTLMYINHSRQLQSVLTSDNVK